MAAKQRYLLFAGDDYYPGGGWSDFIASYATLSQAEGGVMHLVATQGKDWWQIVDTHKLGNEIVKSSRKGDI